MPTKEALKVDNHDDTQDRLITLSSTEPFDTLYLTLAKIQMDCDQLMFAIRRHDWTDAAFSAEEAVASYIAARATLQRIGDHMTEDLANAKAASASLRAAYNGLLQRFGRTAAEVNAPTLVRVLNRLGIVLVLANGALESVGSGG
jgi:hypothetical protein